MFKTFSLRSAPVLVATVLLNLILSQAAFAHHLDGSGPYAFPNPPCYDIIGSGKPVLVGGVANSGTVTFDQVAGNPLHDYEACAYDPDNDPTIGLFQVRGWAWDDNLGWISFYCPSGAGATNLGISCSNGSYTGGYGVTIDPATGKFGGYAWGDNVGWIKFDNPGFSTVKTDATNPVCQGYVYATVKPDPSCPAHTKADTAAWSDNVGWIDFDGILLPWYSLTVEIDDAGVVVTFVKTGTSTDLTGIDLSNAPYANGSDSYTLRLSVHDKKGNAVNPGGRYTVTATPEWAADSVKKDQTQPASALSIDNKTCSDTTNGAVTKPCTSAGMVSTGSGNYDGIVTSIAPTTNMNGADTNGDNAVDYSYESFTLPSSLAASPLQPNQLLLQDLAISIIDNTAGGACVYGLGGGACTPKQKIPAGGNNDVKFKPQTNVTSLKSPPSGDFPTGSDQIISIGAGTPQPFSTVISGPSTVTFKVGIDGSPSSDYGFQFDTDSSGTLEYPPGDADTMTATAGTTSLSAGVGVKPKSAVPAYIPGLYMYSSVDEGGGVKYFSNKLPKTLGSVAVLPVAVLRGNVYSSGASATTTSVQAVRSLGDVSTNILRDTIFRNVSRIIAGVPKPSSDLIELMPDGAGGFMQNDTTGNLSLLLQDDTGKEKVYYHYGDLVLNNPSGDVTWSKERTIIVIGGNVYIRTNVYNDPTSYAGSQKPKLGIIVLKDLTADPAAQAQQGHVYINSNITHIQANIFADGSVFSAPFNMTTPPVLTNGLGEPTFAATVVDQENALKYTQLFIEGSLASQNTVGGSNQTQPVIGTGEIAAGSDKVLESRMYDLNYLRYYTGVIKRDGSGVPLCGNPLTPVVSESEVVLTDTSGAPWTVYASPAGCLFSPVDPASGASGPYQSAFPSTGTPREDFINLGATYIYFDPPTATLPGFGAEAGGTQKQLPQ